MSGRMGEVELVEQAGDAPAGAQDDGLAARRSRALRLVRRWWPVPVLVLAGVVAWQLVSDAREQERLERLRATPGVLDETVTEPLEAREWGTPDTVDVLFGGVGTVHGDVVGVVYPTTRRADVVGLDPTTGEEAWRIPIADRSDEPWAPSVDCGDPVGTTLWCTVDEVVPGDGDAAVRTRLVEVDLAAQSVVGGRDLPDGATVAVVGDLLAVATASPEGAAVEASDVASGSRRWRTVLDDTDSAPWLGEEEGRLLVWGGSGAWLLDPVDGRVQAEGDGLTVVDGQVLDWQGSGVRLLGPDGRGTAWADGTPVGVWPDDGSAHGLLVLRRDDGTPQGRMRAVDPGTGEVAWERTLPQDGTSSLVLLDGVLYGAGGTTVWAVDAATGAEVWTAEGERSDASGTGLLTDGVALLRAERAPGDGDRLLAAYRLTDGRRLWATPLPGDVVTLWAQQGRLFGQGSSTVYAVG
ncbi:PQQ-binding-like beta-propeller repeat protein [Cellulomonas hominis]|uniref:outer membrane protein assembly factor BamB family protein n=1 Tax=Cellulomonas hominis TaxID=156981 RepID=UPI001443AB5F|nr:PQQ-binding-like beta-propeller repeat protein [Cellulomonas hominis]NKY09899.1 PQQ-binding-like beta-propeller repeat protein [Cellulomonas hominis]